MTFNRIGKFMAIMLVLCAVAFSQTLPTTCTYVPGRTPTVLTMPVGSILNAAVTLTGTTFTVASGTSVSNGDFLYIENEVVHVTAGGGTTSLTVTRNYAGSAAAHAAGVGFTDLNVSQIGYCVNGVVIPVFPNDLALTQFTGVAIMPPATGAVQGRLYLWNKAATANTCPPSNGGSSGPGTAYAVCVTVDGTTWKAINLN
jgi:hypothetical protein